MKKVARMLRPHEELLLSWFRAKGEISTGTVEGLNNKIRVVTVVTRRSYGFRTDDAMEMAFITRWDDFPNPNQPKDFAEEAEMSPIRQLVEITTTATALDDRRLIVKVLSLPANHQGWHGEGNAM